MAHSHPDPSRRQTLCALVALHTAALHTMNASAAQPLATTPSEVTSGLQQVQLQGRAQLRFFGLLVYEARLWTPPSFQAERYEQSPFALELQYARKLEGPAIAERSIAEMRRVDEFSEVQSKAWLALMNQAFPNVNAQDRLTGVHDGAGGVRFYFNGKQTAATEDKAYARLFFGIWLSPKTSAPGLRNALIGQG